MEKDGKDKIMMEIIGWITVVVIGIIALVQFFALNLFTKGFGGKFSWFSLIFLGAAIGLFVLAYHYSPFEINLKSHQNISDITTEEVTK